MPASASVVDPSTGLSDTTSNRRSSMSGLSMVAPRPRAGAVMAPLQQPSAASPSLRLDSAAVLVSPLSVGQGGDERHSRASWSDAHSPNSRAAQMMQTRGVASWTAASPALHAQPAPTTQAQSPAAQTSQLGQVRRPHERERPSPSQSHSHSRGGSSGSIHALSVSATPLCMSAPLSSPLSPSVVTSPLAPYSSVLGSYPSPGPNPSPGAMMPPRSPLFVGSPGGAAAAAGAAVSPLSLMYAPRGGAVGSMHRSHAQNLAPLSLPMSMSRSASRDVLRSPNVIETSDAVSASASLSPSNASFNASKSNQARRAPDHSKRLTSPSLGSLGAAGSPLHAASAGASSSAAASSSAVATPARRESMSMALTRAHLGAAASAPGPAPESGPTKATGVAGLHALPSLQRLSSPQPTYARSALFPASPHTNPINVSASPYFTAVASPLPALLHRPTRSASVATLLPPLAPPSLPATPGPMHAPPDLDLETDVLGGGSGGGGFALAAASLLSFTLPKPVVLQSNGQAAERTLSLSAAAACSSSSSSSDLAAPVAHRPAGVLRAHSLSVPRDQPVGTGVLLTHNLLSRWRPVSPDVAIDPRDMAAAQNIVDEHDNASAAVAVTTASAAAVAAAHLSPPPPLPLGQLSAAAGACIPDGMPALDGTLASSSDDDVDCDYDMDTPDLRSPRVDPFGLDLRSPRMPGAMAMPMPGSEAYMAMASAAAAAAHAVPRIAAFAQQQAQAAQIHPHKYLRGSAYTAHGLPPVIPPLELASLELQGGGVVGVDSLVSPASSLASPTSMQQSDSYRAGTAPPPVQLLRPQGAPAHLLPSALSASSATAVAPAAATPGDQASFRLEGGMMATSPREETAHAQDTMDPPVLRASLPPSSKLLHGAPLALSPSSNNQRLLVERGPNSSATPADSDATGSNGSSAGSPPFFSSSSTNHSSDAPLRPLALLAARGCRAASTGDTAPSHTQAHANAHAHPSRHRPSGRGPGHVRGNASHSGAIKLVHPSQRLGVAGAAVAVVAGPQAHLGASQSTQVGSLRSSESSSPPGCWGSTGVSPPTAGASSLLLLDAEPNTLAAALQAVSPHLSPIGTASLHARREGAALLAATAAASAVSPSAMSRSLGATGSGLSLHASTRPLRSNIIPATHVSAFPSF